MRFAIALLMALGLGASLQADPHRRLSNPTARLRPMNARVDRILAIGMERSATFRMLVHQIEASDVIVYIDWRYDVRDDVGASMRFMTRTATDRFVHIVLNARHHNHTLVALLGHELQHAVEVVEHPEVRSAGDLRTFYRTTGLRTGPDSFDSIRAREAGYVVRAEMLQKGNQVRLARMTDVERHLLERSSVGEDTSASQ